MTKKGGRVALLIFFLILLGIMIFTANIQHSNSSSLHYSEIEEEFSNENVRTVSLTGEQLTLRLHKADDNGNTVLTYRVASPELFYNDFHKIIEEQYEEGIIESYDYQGEASTPWWLATLPYLLIVILLMVFWAHMLNRAGSGGGMDQNVMKFVETHAQTEIDENKKVTFSDVAGADEEKAELQEIVDFLRNPDKYTKLGAVIPRGVLLVGPPGTGKTLIARAVAGEANVQFFSISGSDFVELYVGVGASRVRNLFAQAKKAAPSIVFIDEIDAVGRQRGAGLGGGHDEREQTLNQLLVELDGFSGSEGVIVMAATNRVDILDHALLRPGRFDRQIYIGALDIRGREAILHVHARNKPISDDVDFQAIAGQTAGFTGADLKNLLNEAALSAARKRQQVIHMDDIESSILKVIAGPQKKSHVVSERERRLTAFHEAGHAVVMHFLPTQDPVHQITIVPRGTAGGMTISLPTEDRSFLSRQEMLEQIVALLGGRVSEAINLKDISTGASNDIQRATSIAHKMVAEYGMSEALGPISFDSESEVFLGRDYGHTKEYSEESAARIDQEISKIMKDCYKKCESMLRAHMDEIHDIAEYLLKNETMDESTFNAVIAAHTKDSSEDIPSLDPA